MSRFIITSLNFSPDYGKDSTLALSTYVGGAYFSTDGGLSWEPRRKGLLSLRLFEVVFGPDYSKDSRMFSADWHRFLWSNDSGEHWHSTAIAGYEPAPVFSGGRFVIASSPNLAADQTILLGTIDGYILKSTDAGRQFSRVASLGESVRNLTFSPNYSRDRTLYAASQKTWFLQKGGGVYR